MTFRAAYYSNMGDVANLITTSSQGQVDTAIILVHASDGSDHNADDYFCAALLFDKRLHTHESTLVIVSCFGSSEYADVMDNLFLWAKITNERPAIAALWRCIEPIPSTLL